MKKSNTEEKEITRFQIIIISLFFGLVGSLLFSLFYAFDKDILSLILDWPFLLFIIIILFISIFHKELSNLMSKVTKIKAGKYEISLSELKDSLEAEIDERVNQIIDAREKEISEKEREKIFSSLDIGIQKAKENLDQYVIQYKTETKNEEEQAKKLIKEKFKLDKSIVVDILFHLISKKYTWRKLTTLARITKQPTQLIIKTIKYNPDFFTVGRSLEGETIYKLSDEYKYKFETELEPEFRKFKHIYQ